jgi:hypothetical protein
MPKRVYGSGSIVERRTKAGAVTLYGRWRRPDGVKVRVRLGVKRSPSYADGLTKAQAEAALRTAMEEDRKQQAARPVVAGAGARSATRRLHGFGTWRRRGRHRRTWRTPPQRSSTT